MTIIGNPKIAKTKRSGKNTGRPSKTDTRFKTYREILIPKIKYCGTCRQPRHNSRKCNVDRHP